MKIKPAVIIVAVLAAVALVTVPALALQERTPPQSGERPGGGNVNRPSGGEGGRPMGGGPGPAGTGSSGGSTWSGGPSGPTGGGSTMSSGGDVSSPGRARGGENSRVTARRAGEAGVGRAAVPRGDAGAPSRGATRAAAGENSISADSREPVREVPQYSRPRGNRPVTGQAVPRGSVTRPNRPGYPGNVYPGFYGPDYWYYYPYGYGYPWYGSFGLGFLYYDPCWFGGAGCYPYGYGYYGPGYGYGGYSTRDDSGAVRLKVKPRNAEVYVDGYYVGVVDQFDGVFQRLRLQSGGHRIEIRAAGYESVVFDVLVPPFETVTYSGELQKQIP